MGPEPRSEYDMIVLSSIPNPQLRLDGLLITATESASALSRTRT